jgi:hypothetical protein
MNNDEALAMQQAVFIIMKAQRFARSFDTKPGLAACVIQMRNDCRRAEYLLHQMRLAKQQRKQEE